MASNTEFKINNSLTIWKLYSVMLISKTNYYFMIIINGTMGTGSSPGVKRQGRGVDHPPPSSAEVKERVELYLYSRSGPSWPVLG
jgi:hypothetical protein